MSSFKGVPEMLTKIGKMRDKFQKEAGAALFGEVQEVEVPECQANAPVKSGDLRDGIHAVGPIFEGPKITVKVTTSPETDDYSLQQHEDLELFHDVGGPKFIERPLNESAPHMASRVAARIDLKRMME